MTARDEAKLAAQLLADATEHAHRARRCTDEAGRLTLEAKDHADLGLAAKNFSAAALSSVQAYLSLTRRSERR